MRALVCMALAGAAAAAVAMAGCGLDVAGLETVSTTGDGGGGVPDASSGGDDVGTGGGEAGGGGDSGSGVVDASSDAPSSSGDGATNACVSALPSGWSLVAYETAQGACPPGYGGGHDEYTGATAGAGACTCSCQITAQPSCTTGTLTTSYGGMGQNTCPSAGESVTVNGNTCSPLTVAGNLADFYASQPLAPSGGSCTGTATGNTSQVTKQGVRYCDVPMASAEPVCEGTAPANFASCIVTSGDVACPAGSPFVNKTLVDDDEMLVCSACTSCAVGGTCSNAKVTFYSDYQCTQQVVQLASDGTCVQTNNANRTVVAAEYSATANATCQASGSSATFSPQGPHTLCCR